MSEGNVDPAIADAIVVAAGRSQRMGGIDKLDWPVGGRPLLAWTLEALAASPLIGSIVVVAAPDRVATLSGAAWLPSRVVAVVAGGARRQDSVIAGFVALEAAVPDPAGVRVVLVHDGARPIVRPTLVAATVAAAEAHGAAIPVLPIVDTVKRLDDGRVVATVDRSTLAAAQTPQAARRAILRAALADPRSADGTWTDEAALLEACRIPVHVVPGDPSNVKVTMPADLARTATLLADDAATVRHGIGHDAHPFGPGRPLMLGGIAIAAAPRLAGHSDGDVVLHAIADGLLGAAGLGDLGRLFPAGPATPVGIASTDLLGDVVARAAAAGWRPRSVDCTIVAARPRLGGRLDAMRDAIAALLGLTPTRVNVKASTGNLDGPEGAGRSISALALVSVEANA